MQTALPAVPTGFTSHLKLVDSSSEDVNGSLKINVSLSKGTTWYNTDGATAANEQAVVAKVVTVSGFKNTAQTNAEKAVAYYKSLPATLALTDSVVAQTLPSSVTQEVLNGFVDKAPAAPEGLTVSLLLVAEGAKDIEGTLTVKVVLAETDAKFFNVEGGEVDKKESAGKDIILSGFKVKTDETNPGSGAGSGQGGEVQVDPTIALVKAWFETVTETKALENETTILPASVTQENLEATVGSLWVAPTNVEGATVVLTLESVDNDAGTLKVKVGLKKAEKWYSLEGVLQDTEASKEVTVTSLQTTADAVKEIYASQGTTIEVSSTRSAKEASTNLDEAVRTFFSVLQTKVSKIKALDLQLRVAKEATAVNDETGTLVVNFYLSRLHNEKTQYFKVDGTTTEVLDQVDGKNVTLSGFKQVHSLEDLAKEINAWKVKENVTLDEAKEFQKLASGQLSDSTYIFNLLNNSASDDTKIKTATTGVEFVDTSKMLTWDINTTSASLVFKATLRRTEDHNQTKEVTFKTDFEGFLPLFLTVKGAYTKDVNNHFVSLVFNELSTGNTFTSWANFIRPFARTNANNERKLLNFANAMGEKIKSTSPTPINFYNLIYPFKLSDVKGSTENPVELMTILSNGKAPTAWIGANSETLVIGGLQNHTGNTNVGNGRPWHFNMVDGTKSGTFIGYKDSQWFITLVNDWRNGSEGYTRGFAPDSAATVRFTSDKGKSPFINGVASATMLLLKAIINNSH
ncbi:hypothetical protein CJF60_00700 [Mycoplasmopsis agassizii]|uniref:Lipoprotein-associated type-17 domain-containing protein n=1 Tax=Mycoplasmopsis agassizii TaxID=33922 RepID=A0ABX4H5L3_9BACT|nr:hypothetical protein CJF60_00700 [Mycoplasmopsis agassizii]